MTRRDEYWACINRGICGECQSRPITPPSRSHCGRCTVLIGRRNRTLPARDRRMRIAYGITLADYNRLLEFQRHRCGLCRRQFTGPPNIDHDHRTKQVRGLLCFRCNKFRVSVNRVDNIDELRGYLLDPPVAQLMRKMDEARLQAAERVTEMMGDAAL